MCEKHSLIFVHLSLLLYMWGKFVQKVLFGMTKVRNLMDMTESREYLCCFSYFN